MQLQYGEVTGDGRRTANEFALGESKACLRRLKAVRESQEEEVNISFDELYQKAKAVLNPRRLSEHAEAGGVGAAILSAGGNVYTGVCIDTGSSMGFCAEHAAAGAMVTAGESQVVKMVAVGWDGRIMPPCGRCREFISQLHDENMDAEVLVAEGVVVMLSALLPYDHKHPAE